MMMTLFKNLILTILLLLDLMVYGGIFFGCRMFLVDIYDPLSNLIIFYISLPHILAYTPYFIFVELA